MDMSSSINGMAEKFRSFLADKGLIELPGCYDTLSAMILEQAGFKCVFLSGYGVAASVMGNPDIGLTTLSETAMMAKYCASRVNVPVVVDADNGYGNEDNVIRTVEELESAGTAVMVMEDQVLPKRCGHTGGKKVLALPQYMRKLEFALKARRTPMVIVARTDSMDIEDAIMRAKTFHSAGADALLIDGLRGMEQLKRVAGEVPGHKQVNLIWGGVTPSMAAADLHALGFKIIQYSTPALYVVTHTLRKAMAQLREHHRLDAIGDVSDSFKDFQKFIEERYLDMVPKTVYQQEGDVTWADSKSGTHKIPAAMAAKPS
jgi:methylisocitrate lyase